MLTLFIILLSAVSVIVLMGNFLHKKKPTYQVSFSINEKIMGGGSYSFSYDPSKTSFGTIKKIYIKHFEKVCPPDEAIKMQYGETNTLDLLDSDISVYWVQFSIEEQEDPDLSYHVTYFSDKAHSYNEGVRDSVLTAFKELENL